MTISIITSDQEFQHQNSNVNSATIKNSKLLANKNPSEKKEINIFVRNDEFVSI